MQPLFWLIPAIHRTILFYFIHNLFTW
jgi:hypothetical protein